MEQVTAYMEKQLEKLRRCMAYLSLNIEHYNLVLTSLQQGLEPPAFQAGKLNKLFSTERRD